MPMLLRVLALVLGLAATLCAADTSPVEAVWESLMQAVVVPGTGLAHLANQIGVLHNITVAAVENTARADEMFSNVETDATACLGAPGTPAGSDQFFDYVECILHEEANEIRLLRPLWCAEQFLGMAGNPIGVEAHARLRWDLPSHRAVANISDRAGRMAARAAVADLTTLFHRSNKRMTFLRELLAQYEYAPTLHIPGDCFGAPPLTGMGWGGSLGGAHEWARGASNPAILFAVGQAVANETAEAAASAMRTSEAWAPVVSTQSIASTCTLALSGAEPLGTHSVASAPRLRVFAEGMPTAMGSVLQLLHHAGNPLDARIDAWGGGPLEITLNCSATPCALVPGTGHLAVYRCNP